MLIRAGLANKAQIARIHKILDKMKEDRPVFTPAERMILQNMFNKMVDLISNNKQIFQQTRRVVREESEEVEELNETIITSSDYKISPSGRKVRARRFKISDDPAEISSNRPSSLPSHLPLNFPSIVPFKTPSNLPSQIPSKSDVKGS